MPHINWKSVSYIINYYLTRWTDNRMPDKRGTDNRGSTVVCLRSLINRTEELDLSTDAAEMELNDNR